MDSEVLVKERPERRLGPHRVPRIECGKCGHEHHTDHTTGEFQGYCTECFGFLRRPTDAETRKFAAFMDWKTRFLESELNTEADSE